MSVFNRLSDIVNANLNSILEQAEDPEKIVRLITQEMQDTLVEVRSASARHMADRRQLSKQLAHIQAESSAWERKAELAIDKGRDDLAKAALREKSFVDDAETQVQGDLIHIEVAIEKLRVDTNSLEEKLRQAKARQKALIVRGQTTKSRMKVRRQLNDASFDTAFERFDLYERRLDEMEGEVESFDLGSLTLSAEIDSLQTDTALDAELAQLKKRLAKPQTMTSSEVS
ncbi:MAG: phage shock protein A [Candidatus Azotimanducaceae bacterium]|jgi:phage shock protein A